MNHRLVKYGIIGFGLHGVKRFVPAFSKARQSSLVAIHKRHPERVKEAQERYGISLGFTDPADLASCPEVEAVIIASPPALHKAHVITAASAGKHVLVEKPMARNSDEVREMITVCRENSVKLFPGFCMRFLRAIRSAREIIAAGRLGEIKFVRALFVYQSFLSQRSWLFDPVVSGGGPIADLGAHLIDLIGYLTGQKIADVKSIVLPRLTDKHIERQATVSMKLENGLPAAMFVSYDLPREKEIVVYGSEARLVIPDFSEVGKIVNLRLERGGEPEIIAVENRDHFAEMLDSFSSAICDDRSPEIPAAAGLYNQMIIDQIYDRQMKD